MRRGVLLGLVCVCVLAIPAAASRQAETVTLKVGQTVPLKTVFDKTTKYRIVMSGLVTLTLKVGTLTQTYDPFHGAQDANCTNSGPSVYLQIKDASGHLIDYSTAGRPPCRKDHRYEFVVNDAYPPAWDLHGKATAYITLEPNPRDWTVSGSFTLRIEPERAATVIFGVNASKRKRAVDDVTLNGRGLMRASSIRFGARLEPQVSYTGVTPVLRYEISGTRNRRLELAVTTGQLFMQGAPGSTEERLSVKLLVEVVESNIFSCAERTRARRGARGTVTLVYYPRRKDDDFVSTFLDLPCGVDESWSSGASDATIRVKG